MPAVDVNLISKTGRIRGLTETSVKSLVDSIAEVGLLNPVTVYRRQITRFGEQVDGYGLIAGAHRLEACKRLGLTDIEVSIVEMDEPHRVLAECDENLCSTALSAADLAEFTSRRKWAYEKIHPETVRGRNQYTDGNGTECQPSFAENQSALTGRSARAIRQDAERGMAICNSALAMVKGTHLDKGKYLNELKNLSAADQIEKIKRDLAAPPAPKPARKAQPPRDDEDVIEGHLAALMAAWNRAPREARNLFLEQVMADQ